MNVDIVIFQWFNSWAGVASFFDALIIFRATYLLYIVIGVVMLFTGVTWFRRFRIYRRRHVELFILSLASAFTARFVVAELIRFFYQRPRPYMVLEGIHVLQHQLFGDLATSGSFPSGHASFGFAIATAVSWYYPKTSVLFFLAAVSIGIGRVAAGVHWPTDIAGGAIVGVLTACAFRFLKDKFFQKKSDSLRVA